METDVAHFSRSLPHFIRLQPFAGMRLAEIPWIPPKHQPFKQQSASLKRLWKSLPLEYVDVLCIHGIHGLQNKALYDLLIPWLEQKRSAQVLFLEEDPQTLLTLLHTEVGYKLVSHPQIALYWLEGGEPERLLLTQLTWDFLHSRWHFIHLPTSPHSLEETARHQRLHEEIEVIRLHVDLLAQELLSCGEVYFNNFYANLPLLGASNCGDRLFKKFGDLPILVCGSGPSLQSQIELLRPLCDRALLIAAGSAVPILLSHGILPHFGVAIDPSLSQAERLEGQVGVDIPYFYRPRLHPRALRAIRGQRLYVAGAGAYETPLYIEQELRIPSSQVEEGYNVLQFALSIAHALQGRPSKRAPLILLGADGAYSQAQEYSRGIPESSRSQTEDPYFKTTREDAQGNLLVTRKQWIAERAWFTQFARQHPETVILNATSGGLPIVGIPHLPLPTCVARYCTRSLDLSGRIWSQLQRTALPRWTSSRVLKILMQWNKSLERIEMAMSLAKKEMAQDNWHLVVCAETLWQSESAYNPIFSLFERIATRLQKVEERRSETLEEKARTTEQQRLFADRLHFLQRVGALHRTLLNKACGESWKETIPHDPDKNSDKVIFLAGKDSRYAIQSSTRRGEVKQEERTSFKTHSGVVLAEGQFQQRLRHGVQRHFYPNGLLAWEGAYDRGEPIGVHRTFFSNSVLKQAIDYSQGHLTLYDFDGARIYDAHWPLI